MEMVTLSDDASTHQHHKLFYRPEIDALRAIAFLFVFLHHALDHSATAYVQYGFDTGFATILSAMAMGLGFGLPLFFFLSAYLIAKLLIIERDRSGKIDIKAFYIRRALRIWPLYYGCVILMTAYALFKHEAHVIQYFTLPYTFFYTNWWIVAYPSGHDIATNLFGALWSLSVEEQFYLIFPIIMIFCNANRLRFVGIALSIVSFISLYAQGSLHWNVDRTIWYNSLSHMIFFGAGIIMATTPVERIKHIPTTLRAFSFISGLFTFFASSYYLNSKSLLPATSGITLSSGYTLSAVGCILLFLSMWGLSAQLPKWLVYLGKVSFGLYVFHALDMQITLHAGSRFHINPVILRLLALPIAIVTAIVSYEYIEKPFLRLRTRFTNVQNRPL
jgi:peptidoglycan/LPS O-acetylase OafA/YrhL